MGNLRDKVVLITGAGQGIGEGIALRLAEDGGDIIVSDVNEENAKKVSENIIKNGGKSIALKIDVSNSASVNNGVKKVIEEFKRIDILVANAGIVQIKGVEDITEEDWDKLMAVNLKGVFLTDKAVIPFMKSQKSGKIINCSSIAGRVGAAYFAHYCAAKFGVIGFSQSIAKELAKYNITVNVYCPGIVDTPMWDRINPALCEIENIKLSEIKQINIDRTLLGRLSTPADVACLVSFLASKDADFMTGQSVILDGGVTIL